MTRTEAMVATGTAATRSSPRARGARRLTAAYGVATLVAVLLFVVTLGRPHRPIWLETAYGIVNVPLSRSLVSVVVLALVTRALAGRQRLGLIAVACFQVVGIAYGAVALTRLASSPLITPWQARQDFGRVLDTLAMVVGLAALWWLWRLRRAFPVKPVEGSWILAGVATLAGFVVALVATLVAVRLFSADGDEGIWSLIRASVEGSLGRHEQARQVLGVAPAWIPDMTSVLLSATIVIAVVLFLRSARHRRRWSGEREVAIRSLLNDHGDQDSLGYFATRRDKASIFEARGRAAVTYRVLGGVSLASGDPVGDPAAWDAAVVEWLAEARTKGWVPAVLSTSETGARAYARCGLAAVRMGDEAILIPSAFVLDGPGMAPVRQAVRHATAEGLTVDLRRQQAIPTDELADIDACAERWRGGEPDRGFSMALNRAGDPADSRILMVTARDDSGELKGVLGFVPWGRLGVSLDVMRRAPDAPNGVTELMVCELLRRAPEVGVERVSLNFVMFRTVYADAVRIGTGPVTRLNHSVLGVLDRFWQLERLYASNAKFQPDWLARFLCVEDWVSLPQVLIAAGQAEGFLPRPRFLDRASDLTLDRDQLAEIRILEQAPSSGPTSDETRRTDQERERLGHLDALERKAREGYPAWWGADRSSVSELVSTGSSGPAQALVTVAGRVRSVRSHGAVAFADLVDGGAAVQILFDDATAGHDRLMDFRRLVDRGDLVLVSGTMGASRTGTRSLIVSEWAMLAKSLHPLPFGAFTDPEARLRHRAADLITNPEALSLLRSRTAVVTSVRDTLQRRGFQEVETPILQRVHGGASARPFTTHINAYDLDLSLRIAPELFLKRLLVAGMGPIFEIGRNFRNEGVDATHNPEFTSLEAYLPYADYTDMRVLTEALVKGAASVVHGGPVLPLRTVDGRTTLTDVSGPWEVVSVLDAVSRAVGTDVGLETGVGPLGAIARRHGVAIPQDAGPGRIIEELYGDLVEPMTVYPTFYVDFPAETSPLTRPHRSHPGLAERWDLVACGMEVGTAYTELTDPRQQRRRLVAQSLRAANGDAEAMEVDEDFLQDLETGMPPSGGLGIGIDRLVMLVTGATIREVLTFPFVKPLPVSKPLRGRGTTTLIEERP